jgi:hypothetical protein
MKWFTTSCELMLISKALRLSTDKYTLKQLQKTKIENRAVKGIIASLIRFWTLRLSQWHKYRYA